jgi:hypothetical protein
MQAGKIGPGIAIVDNAAVHYVNGEIHQVVTTKQTSAYEVFIKEGKIVETRLNSISL